MSSTRDFKSPGIFAAAASTTIPPTPIAGVAYRDAVSGTDDVPNGWRYGTRVDSKDWNQVMFLLTSMLSMLDVKGLLGYSDQVDYSEPSLVFGSDGTVYSWLLENGPGTGAGVQDPVSAPTYWRATGLGDTSIYQQSGAPVYVTSTQTVTFPAGVRAMLVEAVGGGGGGGGVVGDGANTAGAAGGGAGRYSRAFLTSGFGASQLCTIGGGGGGSSGAGAGGNGGTTSFGSILTAAGGLGGQGTTSSATYNVANGGTGGITGVGADYSSVGGHGGNGQTFGTVSNNRGIAGDGGASAFGAGGRGKALLSTDSYPGVAGVSPGSGGGGAGVGSTLSTTVSGGAGAPGLIKITYYK